MVQECSSLEFRVAANDPPFLGYESQAQLLRHGIDQHLSAALSPKSTPRVCETLTGIFIRSPASKSWIAKSISLGLTGAAGPRGMDSCMLGWVRFVTRQCYTPLGNPPLSGPPGRDYSFLRPRVSGGGVQCRSTISSVTTATKGSLKSCFRTTTKRG